LFLTVYYIDQVVVLGSSTTVLKTPQPSFSMVLKFDI